MDSSSRYSAVLTTPIGLLGIVLDDAKVVAIERVEESVFVAEPQAPLAVEATRQLAAYFNSAKFCFDLPLLAVGTEFQQSVWRQLLKIRPGQVQTYGDIAKAVGSSPRAVGGACRANPLMIVIPCHRVVARTGIGGYGGETTGHNMQQKQWLLAHEGTVHL